MGAVTSTLEHVTVYRQGAVCLRRASVPAGSEREVRLTGLPLSLEPTSLRAGIRQGPSNLRVLEIRPGFEAAQLSDTQISTDQRELEAAQASLLALRARRTRVEAQIAELHALVPVFREPEEDAPPRPASVDAVLTLAKFVDGELDKRLAERRQLAQELADAEEAVTLRERRIAEASTAAARKRTQLARVAVLTLSESPTGPVELSLEYEVPGARWAPTYALQLDRSLTAGALRMRASVAQKSGEDWSQVRIALSTAVLDRQSTLPELRALVIGRRQEPPRPKGWREPPPGLEELFQSYDAVALERLAPLRPMPKKPAPAPRDEAPKKKASKSEAADEVAAAPPEMARMSRSRASLAMAAGGAPMAPPAAAMNAPAGFAKDAFGEEDDAEDGYGRSEPAPEPPPESVLAASMLDYSQLTLVGVEAGGARGKLTASVSMQLEWTVHAVLQAQAQAMSVQALPLPGGDPARPVSAFDYRYDGASPVDVPSTGQWTSLTVMACEVGVAPRYVCVPSVETKVYRVLGLTNRSTHALLGGPVDVSAGDTFLLTSTLPPMGPGAQAEHGLGLGVEESIKVARRTQHNDTTGGFLGGGRLLAHEIEVEVRNTLGTPASIEVRERVPILAPDEKEAKLEDVRATPPWEKDDAPVDGRVVRGSHRWNVTVPPGQNFVLRAQYAIRLGAGRALVGGNRREG